MRYYLSTLHKRSPEHKNKFALLVSAVITLSIFTIWSVVRFHSSTSVTASNANSNVEEVSPFGALKSGVATALQALTETKQEVKSGLEQVPTYGR